MLPTPERHQAVAAIKDEIIARYPSVWQAMITDWRKNINEDRVWLPYSASYLFRSGGRRWAIDPFTIYTRLKQPAPMDLAAGLSSLDFVLLTHKHADHLDLPLIRSLAGYPIHWVIPEFLLPLVADCGLDPAAISVPIPGQALSFGDLQITPFPGLHTHITPDGVQRGVPAMGYHIQRGMKTWLFPGDTRSHQAEMLPAFAAPDVLFAHLWLGKACADMEKPPKLEDFCRFFLALNPRRLVITHLHEIGRVPNEFWDMNHYEMLRAKFLELKPGINISAAQIGESIGL